MKTIFKYSLEITDHIELELPNGAVFLSLHTQHGAPCMWFLVDTNETARETRIFYIAGTGHPLATSVHTLKFLGTFLVHNDTLVFHVFERI